MNPSFQDQLQEWGRKNNMPASKKKKRLHTHKKRKSEHLSEYEIKDLMGYYEPVYKRGRGGAWRNGR